MRKYITIVILVLSVMRVVAQPQPLKSFSVKEAEEFALQNKSEAKNAALGINQAKARNWEIISTGLPVISGSADYTYYYKRPESPAIQKIFGSQTQGTIGLYQGIKSVTGNTTPNEQAFQQYLSGAINGLQQYSSQPIYFQLPHNLQAGVQLTELLFDGRYVVGIKATKDFMKLARLTKDVSDQDVRYNVRKAYYQAQAAHEAKALLASNQEIIDKLLNDTREIFKAGFSEELDVNRLELISSNLQSQIQTQEQMADIAIANLKFQMGLSVSDQIVLTDKLETMRDKLAPQALTFNPNQRPEYELLQTANKIRGHDAKQVEAGYMPTLAGFVSYGGGSQVDKFGDIFRKNEDGKNNWFQQGLVGLSLKVPIFDSGMRGAQVRQKKLEQQKGKNDFDNFMKALELQLEVSQTTFNSCLREELSGKRSLELSEKIYNKNRIKFKEGVGSSFELVQAQQDFVTNQLKKVQNALAVLNAKADLDKTLGLK